MYLQFTIATIYSVIAITPVSSARWRPCSTCFCFGDQRVDCNKNVNNNNVTLNDIPSFFSPEIEQLNITEQHVLVLKNNVFSNLNLTNLRKVFIEKSAVKTVELKAFESLELMTDLSLMYNDISVLEPGLFATNVFLKYLWLDNNRIKQLPSGLFDGLEFLSGIYARYNQIFSVGSNIFKDNLNVWLIDLSNNKLKIVNSTLIEHLKYLKIIFLQENPLTCDCRLKNLHKIMKKQNFYNYTQPVCSNPAVLKGNQLRLLRLSDYKCWLNITIIPEKQLTIYDARNTTFNCLVDAIPEPNVNWFHNNNLINLNKEKHKYFFNSSAINNTTQHNYNLTIFNVTVEDNGIYSCIANNTEIKSSLNFTLNIIKSIHPKVEILQNPSKINWEIDNYNLSCKYSGVPKPTTYWIYNNTKIINSTDQEFIIKHSINSNDLMNTFWVNLTIKTVNYKHKGEYTCIAIANSDKTNVNKTVELSIQPPFSPEVTVTTSANQQLEYKLKMNVTLKCQIKSFSMPTLYWNFNNKKLMSFQKYRFNQTTVSNLIIINLKESDLGLYTCVANSTSHIANNSLIIKLKKKPEIKIIYKRTLNTITLSCNVEAFPRPIINWKYNNVSCLHLKDNTIQNEDWANDNYWYNLTIQRNFTYNDNGIYVCEAFNEKGNTTDYVVLDLKSDSQTKFTFKNIWFLITLVLCFCIIVIIIFLITTICIKCKRISNCNLQDTNPKVYNIENNKENKVF